MYFSAPISYEQDAITRSASFLARIKLLNPLLLHSAGTNLDGP